VWDFNAVIGGGLNDGLPRFGFDFLIVEYELWHRSF
jgi:hypothetical protein